MFSPQNWHIFNSQDIEEKLITFIEEGNIRNTILIWRRHLKEFENSSIPDNFTNSILSLLPHNISPSSYCSWLKYEVLPHMNKEERYVYYKYINISIEFC